MRQLPFVYFESFVGKDLMTDAWADYDNHGDLDLIFKLAQILLS